MILNGILSLALGIIIGSLKNNRNGVKKYEFSTLCLRINQ